MYACPDNWSWVTPRHSIRSRRNASAAAGAQPRRSAGCCTSVAAAIAVACTPHHGPTASAKPQPDSWGLPTLSTAPGIAFQHHPADHRLSAHEVEAAVTIRTPRQLVNPYAQAPLWPEANSTAFPSPESDDGESLRRGSGSHSMSRIEMVFTVAVAAAFMAVTAVLLVPH